MRWILRLETYDLVCVTTAQHMRALYITHTHTHTHTFTHTHTPPSLTYTHTHTHTQPPLSQTLTHTCLCGNGPAHARRTRHDLCHSYIHSHSHSHSHRHTYLSVWQRPSACAPLKATISWSLNPCLPPQHTHTHT